MAPAVSMELHTLQFHEISQVEILPLPDSKTLQDLRKMCFWETAFQAPKSNVRSILDIV